MTTLANTQSLATNLNIDPYYDDFNEGRNFHRLLFRPGFAVQARELTQFQTILQNQIDRFGEHIFNTGKSLFLLGDIHHNEIKEVPFSFFAMVDANQDLPIILEIKENSGKYDQLIPTGLVLNKLINKSN